MDNTMELAKQRIERTEIALKRTEEMIALNIARCSMIATQRRLIETAGRLLR